MNNVIVTSNLILQQIKAINQLMDGIDLAQVCRNVNISKSTLYNWLQEPEFRSELDRQRKELIDCALNKLKTGIGKAVDKLISLLESENEFISRRAAESILEYAFKLKELEDLTQRIEKVERIILERRVSYGNK